MAAVVLALDAGFAATGAVLVDTDGNVHGADCYRTVPDNRKRGVRVADSDAERCAGLAAWLLTWARQVQGVVVELPTGGAQGARANRAMGMATGVVAACLYAAGRPVEWVTPAAVKVAATGYRNATKEQVQAGVLQGLTWPIWQVDLARGAWPHIADAAGAYLAAADGALIRALRGRGA